MKKLFLFPTLAALAISLIYAEGIRERAKKMKAEKEAATRFPQSTRSISSSTQTSTTPQKSVKELIAEKVRSLVTIIYTENLVGEKPRLFEMQQNSGGKKTYELLKGSTAVNIKTFLKDLENNIKTAQENNKDFVKELKQLIKENDPLLDPLQQVITSIHKQLEEKKETTEIIQTKSLLKKINKDYIGINLFPSSPKIKSSGLTSRGKRSP